MALKATIYKAELEIADMERNYYAAHTLTLARHPSETDERLMVRVLAFALHADDSLAFGRGLSSDDEPDLWRKDLTGAIDCWIDVGLPDERLIRKACGRARQVFVYSYGGRAADVWWDQCGAALARLDNLAVINLPAAATQDLAALAQRGMRLNCTIQEGQVWLSGPDRAVQVEPVALKPARQGAR